jgi:hypothetical protein
MLHNLSLAGMIAVSLVFLAVGGIVYNINLHLFAAAIKFVRLSSKSDQYGEIVGSVRSLAIEMDRITEEHHLRERYCVSMDYDFSVDGQIFKGGDAVQCNDRAIPKVIKYCQKRFPDQIVGLKVEPDAEAGGDPTNLKEFKTFLTPMYYGYKPNKATIPISVLYDKTNPSDNCPKEDTKAWNIVGIVISILIASVIGAVFVGMGCMMFKFLPEEKSFWNMLIVYPLFLTAIVPAFFIKTSLSEEAQTKNREKDQSNPVFELIIDKNVSEASLREQLSKQKAKYQYLLQKEK